MVRSVLIHYLVLIVIFIATIFVKSLFPIVPIDQMWVLMFPGT